MFSLDNELNGDTEMYRHLCKCSYWRNKFIMGEWCGKELLGTIDIDIPLFIAGCVVDSYLYAALLKFSRGNILIAMIFHMTSNFL